jgi:hypothetical protein
MSKKKEASIDQLLNKYLKGQTNLSTDLTKKVTTGL